jgi:hypothetical protein
MNDVCFIVRDKNGQQLGYFYYEVESGRRTWVNMLSKDEAPRLAVNFAKLPELLMRKRVSASRGMFGRRKATLNRSQMTPRRTFRDGPSHVRASGELIGYRTIADEKMVNRVGGHECGVALWEV